jgi:hypothetical protein
VGVASCFCVECHSLQQRTGFCQFGRLKVCCCRRDSCRGAPVGSLVTAKLEVVLGMAGRLYGIQRGRKPVAAVEVVVINVMAKARCDFTQPVSNLSTDSMSRYDCMQFGAAL